MNEPVANTDRELWREPPGDYYANSIHVTQDGKIGINVGGTVIVKSLAEWHVLDQWPYAEEPIDLLSQGPFTEKDFQPPSQAWIDAAKPALDALKETPLDTDD